MRTAHTHRHEFLAELTAFVGSLKNSAIQTSQQCQTALSLSSQNSPGCHSQDFILLSTFTEGFMSLFSALD